MRSHRGQVYRILRRMHRLRYLNLLATLAAGCGDPASPASAPATATSPATQAATTQIAVPPMKLTIEGREFTFTPAVLTVSGQPPRLLARLYSEDQGGGEEANAVYLDCPLELEPDAPLTSAIHRSKTVSRERGESLAGIFLPAEHAKLQPLELSLTLAEHAAASGADRPPAVMVNLKATFLVFPEDTDVPTSSVEVSGVFPARVKYETAQ